MSGAVHFSEWPKFGPWWFSYSSGHGPVMERKAMALLQVIPLEKLMHISGTSSTLNPISHRRGLLGPRFFSAAYYTAFTKEVVNDTNWLLRYVHHRQFKKKFKALAARHFVWRPSESRGPLIFFDFSFINFGADIFRAFRLDFWKALKSRVLKLEANFLSIDMCKETA